MREIAAMRGIMRCAGSEFAGEVSTVRERVSGWLYVLGWTVVCRMPRRWAEWMFRQIADQLWRRQGPGVRQLEANLARVIGPDASVMDLRRLSRDGMRSYLRYWLEAFRLPVTAGGDPRPDAGGWRGADRVPAPGAGRGVIFALPHMGNWEHAGAWIVLRGAAKVTTVAERLRPESLYDRFVTFRERLGMEVLPHSAGASRFGVLAQRLQTGGLVGLLCERDLTGSGIEVEFFGEPARIMGGPAALAEQTGAALMPVTLWYEERTGARHSPGDSRARDRYPAGEDRRHDPAAGEGVRGCDRQAPGGLAHAAEGVRRRSRHRQAARHGPATAARPVTAPRRHPSRSPRPRHATPAGPARPPGRQRAPVRGGSEQGLWPIW